jgi:hypothetical protein
MNITKRSTMKIIPYLYGYLRINKNETKHVHDGENDRTRKIIFYNFNASRLRIIFE